LNIKTLNCYVPEITRSIYGCCLRRKNIGTVQNVGQRSITKNLYVEGIKHDDRVKQSLVEAP